MATVVVHRNQQGLLRLIPEAESPTPMPGEAEIATLDLDDAEAAAFLAGWAAGDARESQAQTQWTRWQAERMAALEDKECDGA